MTAMVEELPVALQAQLGQVEPRKLCRPTGGGKQAGHLLRPQVSELGSVRVRP